jgi:hypothetical protein
MPDLPIPKRHIQLKADAPTPANDVSGRRKLPAFLANIEFDKRPDSLANQEASALASGQLEEIATQNAHRRSEAAKGQLHFLAIGAIGFAGVAMLSIACVWVYHFLTPDSWHFLPRERVEEMKTVLLAGIVFSRFRDHITKHL